MKGRRKKSKGNDYAYLLDHNADWLRKAGFDHFVFLLESKPTKYMYIYTVCRTLHGLSTFLSKPSTDTILGWPNETKNFHFVVCYTKLYAVIK